MSGVESYFGKSRAAAGSSLAESYSNVPYIPDVIPYIPPGSRKLYVLVGTSANARHSFHHLTLKSSLDFETVTFMIFQRITRLFGLIVQLAA